MRRLVVLIVIVFAFASVAGMTTAHAHRYISTPIVVLNLVDGNNQSIPVMVSVKHGEIDLGSGIMLPCGAHQGIPVAVDQLGACPPPSTVPLGADEARPYWPTSDLLRPPIGA